MQGQLCVLAEDCDQPDYKKLVEALCSEHNVSLLSVPEAKQLGQWAGVSRTAFLHASHNHSTAASRVSSRHLWSAQAELWAQGSAGLADAMVFLLFATQLQFSVCAHDQSSACDAAWKVSGGMLP